MSWGYKPMCVFIVFAAMMGYMVYRCSGSNFELVEKEYYKSELRYQDIIDGSAHAHALSALPSLKQSGNSIVLQLPAEMKNATVSGSVFFYCAYDEKKDRTIRLSVDESGKQSMSNTVSPGAYTVKIAWNAGGKNYYTEERLTIL